MSNLERTIAEKTRKKEVDQRLPLKLYYRTAHNVLRQADIYRAEKNIIELYILLFRFTSLITETIPDHKDVKSPLYKDEKSFFRKKSIEVLNELERLKPEIEKIQNNGNYLMNDSYSFPNSNNTYSRNNSNNPNDLNNYIYTFNDSNNWDQSNYNTQNQSQNLSQSQSPNYYSNSNNNNSQVIDFLTGDFNYQPTNTAVVIPTNSSSQSNLFIPKPKSETLQKHSLFEKPNQSFHTYSMPKINYPSNVDSSPIVLPDLLPTQESVIEKKSLPDQISWTEENVSQNDMHSTETISHSQRVDSKVNLIRQPTPPPVLTEITTLVRKTENESALQVASDHSDVRSDSFLSSSAIPPSAVADPFPGSPKKMEDDSKKVKSLHISPKMMEEFMRLVKSNTKKNLETCGVLAGILKKGNFFVTTLILPKQEATSDSCNTLNEEEIFDTQDKKGLFQLGWIHTHPSQTCFMSSIDLHTHYSYQIMLPEAIAIVMAPSDPKRRFGIFHLSEPGGMKVIQKCDKRGFHSHESPPNGGVIYEHCSHVYLNEGFKCEFIDLR